MMKAMSLLFGFYMKILNYRLHQFFFGGGSVCPFLTVIFDLWNPYPTYLDSAECSVDFTKVVKQNVHMFCGWLLYMYDGMTFDKGHYQNRI